MIIKENFNPYKKSFGDIYRALTTGIGRRLIWDLNPESISSSKKFKKLKNKYAGEKAVILFNGPSLLKADFESLKNTYTFGLNKVNLIFEEKNFIPNILVAFDSLLNEQNTSFLSNSPHLLKILAYDSYKDLKKRGEDYIYLYHQEDPSFCYDPSSCVVNRGSTPYITFQIAYYMGFEQIAIVGADHNFPNLPPMAKIKNLDEDKYHFHKDYHKKGDVNQYPDRLKLDILFRDIKLAYEMKGRKIYNATEGGNLEIFERKNLHDFINGI
ncbi:6-hydroxymethylpterin diphosphokinase MptE-like protein [Sporocytophaga myxococcoides]|uniref:6-hydroxymethylpterin diphosphokinase MptE-like protein n=1 Tax=Sporocytophaga myxococcoides TaxID=153721 RepID=UPI0004183C91|nr:6-hydroxymethylpterin diphosphokinase MptE-like protein [Sporocytophaga myxococcoides]